MCHISKELYNGVKEWEPEDFHVDTEEEFESSSNVVDAKDLVKDIWLLNWIVRKGLFGAQDVMCPRNTGDCRTV